MREGMDMGTLVKRGGGVGLAFVAETHTLPFNYLYQSKTILSLLFTSSVPRSQWILGRFRRPLKLTVAEVILYRLRVLDWSPSAV